MGGKTCLDGSFPCKVVLWAIQARHMKAKVPTSEALTLSYTQVTYSESILLVASEQFALLSLLLRPRRFKP